MKGLVNLEVIKIKITPAQDEASRVFAEKSDYSKYADRNQTDINEMIRQNYEGKKAEFGVYNWKKSIGEDVSEVDITIYPSEDKSFIQDLQSNGEKIHVKSENIEKGKQNGTPSFLFQYGNAKRTSGDKDKHAFNKKCKDQVVLCVVDGDIINIVARTRIDILHDNEMFCQPRSPRLYGIKKAVYLCDLEQLENGNIQVSGWQVEAAQADQLITVSTHI